MRDALVVPLIPLAAYYVTWLVVHSRIATPLVARWQVSWERHWDRRHPDAEPSDEWRSSLAYLPTCAWCSGFWISGAVIGVTSFFTAVPLWGLMWPATAALVGLIDTLTHREA